MHFIKKIAAVLLLLFTAVNAMAQQTVEMADQLRADGKIYVVVVVAAIVLMGILVYVVRLDGKLSKLEKDLKSHSK